MSLLCAPDQQRMRQEETRRPPPGDHTCCDDVCSSASSTLPSGDDTSLAETNTPSQDSGLGLLLFLEEHLNKETPFVFDVSIPCGVVVFKPVSASETEHKVSDPLVQNIFYKVVMQVGATIRWTVLKRYTEFVDLHESLKKKRIKKLPSLPRRDFITNTNNSRKRVEKRRLLLEAYLRALPPMDVLALWASAPVGSLTTRDSHGTRIHTVCRYASLGHMDTPLEIHIPYAQLRYNAPQDYEIALFFRPGEGVVHVAPRYREITDLARWMELNGDVIPDGYETQVFLMASFHGQMRCPLCEGPLIAAVKIGWRCRFPGHTWVASARTIRSLSRKRIGAYSNAHASRLVMTTKHTVQSSEDPKVFLKTSLCTCNDRKLCRVGGRVNSYEFVGLGDGLNMRIIVGCLNER